LLPGASVVVVHKPTGTKFSTTNGTGGYAVKGIRQEVPYTCKGDFIGFKTRVKLQEINAPLGSSTLLLM
jgi:hypothetical protein